MSLSTAPLLIKGPEFGYWCALGSVSLSSSSDTGQAAFINRTSRGHSTVGDNWETPEKRLHRPPPLPPWLNSQILESSLKKGWNHFWLP